jgi:hypothetical protein
MKELTCNTGLMIAILADAPLHSGGVRLGGEEYVFKCGVELPFTTTWLDTHKHRRRSLG